MQLYGSLPAPDPARVRRIERYRDIRFPPAYLDFLTHANGARVRDGAHGDLVVERFLPILDDYATHPDGDHDLDVVASQLDSRLTDDPDATGLSVVPVAALFGGDMLVLDYRGAPGEPSVGRWDHEASDDFRPVVRPVAATFAAFLDRV